MNLFDGATDFVPPPGKRLVVSYGAGVDSTAILVEMVSRVRAGDLRYLPDAIVFADTGGEKPETYDYIRYFSNWLRSQGFPRITTVRAGGKWAVSEQGGLEVPTGLEAKCLGLETLPPIAFGWKTCSDAFKIRPITAHLRGRQMRRGELLADVAVIIGFDASEERRIKVGQAAGDAYERLFPLFWWGWGREDCIRRIMREGLLVPIKSACFFCPSSKPPEIHWLAIEHPELAVRAMLLEGNSTKHDPTKIKGLGRSRAWTPLLIAANAGLAAHATEATS